MSNHGPAEPAILGALILRDHLERDHAMFYVVRWVEKAAEIALLLEQGKDATNALHELTHLAREVDLFIAAQFPGDDVADLGHWAVLDSLTSASQERSGAGLSRAQSACSRAVSIVNRLTLRRRRWFQELSARSRDTAAPAEAPREASKQADPLMDEEHLAALLLAAGKSLEAAFVRHFKGREISGWQELVEAVTGGYDREWGTVRTWVTRVKNALLDVAPGSRLTFRTSNREFVVVKTALPE